jgi:hypothetical protein
VTGGVRRRSADRPERAPLCTIPPQPGAATALTVAAAFTQRPDGTAHLVRIRAEHSGDTPGISLVGLPAEHAGATRDRLYAACTTPA